MKKHLEFKGSKTSWEVFNTKKEPLGVIWFNNEWKCFVWEQYDGIIMSHSCLTELNDFVGKLDSNKKYGRI